jgi:NADPH-dependent curcumin reductase CurA
VRHHFLSLDPYMRGRMNDSKSYAAPQPLGEVMIGGTVGEVLESRHPKFKAGDAVVGMGGWQTHSVVDANVAGALRTVDTTHVPLSHYLGAVGMPGVTAWYGLVNIIAPKAGETVTVSAASGAVGSAYGALAKARGCRVVGIAGGADKCHYVTQELGFDACIDYKQHPDYISLSKALKAACPDGIDGHFENAGGQVLDAVMLRMNAFGRIAVCARKLDNLGRPADIFFQGNTDFGKEQTRLFRDIGIFIFRNLLLKIRAMLSKILFHLFERKAHIGVAGEECGINIRTQSIMHHVGTHMGAQDA